MKKIILFAIIFLFTFPCFSQTDLYLGIGPNYQFRTSFYTAGSTDIMDVTHLAGGQFSSYVFKHDELLGFFTSVYIDIEFSGLTASGSVSIDKDFTQFKTILNNSLVM